jgi:hypothetical protein
MIRALLWLAFPAIALCQVQVVYEPLPELTKRVFGEGSFVLWNVTAVTDDDAQHVLPRALVVAATVQTELTLDQTDRELRRAAQLNGLGMAGRLWDATSPLIGPALVGYGFAKDSKASQWAGSGVAAISVIRMLLKGTAPRAEDYITGILPDQITCEARSCGVWYVVTTNTLMQRFQVTIPLTQQAETLERLRRVRLDVFGYAWD